MSSPFIAEVRIFGFGFPPSGWAYCNGQLMAISQNTALFSLLGTYFGGDGKTTFALPDFSQARMPIGQGQGDGMSDRTLGESGGVPYVTLLEAEMSPHAHTVQVSNEPADISTPSSATAIARSTGQSAYGPPDSLQPMNPQTANLQGSSQPHNNLMPYLLMNFCIALQGVYPARP